MSSLHLINAGRLPLLIVPQRLKVVSLPKHAVLASDEEDFTAEGSPLLSILEKLRPYLSIIKVTPSTNEATRHERLRQLAQAKLRPDMQVSIQMIGREDVERGIMMYCSDAWADLLIMVHRRQSLLDWLLHGTVTKGFVLHPKIPLLVLPE